ncbi:MAG TPA: hypothetical protein VED40_16485 [Azospirillaceae bacterium]|nr:hypothetical protein [Azospirillaceae bacterium]
MQNLTYPAISPARPLLAALVTLTVILVVAAQGLVLGAIPHGLAAAALPGPVALALFLLAIPLVQLGCLRPYWTLRRRLDPSIPPTRWWFGYLARRPVTAAVEHLSPLLLLVGWLVLAETRPLPQDLAVWSVDERGTLMLDGPIGLSAGGAFRERAAGAGAAEGLRVVLRSNGGSGLGSWRTVGAMRAVQADRPVVAEVPSTCHSACIPVFFSADKRVAAPDALFIFHEADAYALPADSPALRLLKDALRPMVRLMTVAVPIMGDAVERRDPGLARFLRQQGVLGAAWYADRRDCGLRAAVIAAHFPGVLELSSSTAGMPALACEGAQPDESSR